MPDPQPSKSRKKTFNELEMSKMWLQNISKNYLDNHVKGHYDCDHCGKGFYGGLGKCQLARHFKADQSELTNHTDCMWFLQ